MKFCTSVIFSSIFLTVSVLANGDILFCADSTCGGGEGGCLRPDVPPDGACNQLIIGGSAKAFSVDNDCSFTVYTDPNCSNGATAVGLLDCKPGLWRSFSYDCQNVDLKA
ncbi:hypothetical protein Egran_00058 [Elaphomyces granulatus]|uniref:Cyanovirin-N domain-containing protein n=1 Tax=Elaphomyces granulatus TaxID=519963 RepID=A0A232M709_9EURO|nr:hypothetical protein Egran_00058 [Elaphomyces granulatus]